jgi:hypothetical protein
MHPALAAMLTQTVQHSAYTGQDPFGKPLYGSAVARACRIEYQIAVTPNQQGQGRVSNTVVYFDGTFPLTVRDKLLLSDGTAPAIQQVQVWEDPLQPGVVDHIKCLL